MTSMDRMIKGVCQALSQTYTGCGWRAASELGFAATNLQLANDNILHNQGHNLTRSTQRQDLYLRHNFIKNLKSRKRELKSCGSTG